MKFLGRSAMGQWRSD